MTEDKRAFEIAGITEERATQIYTAVEKVFEDLAESLTPMNQKDFLIVVEGVVSTLVATGAEIINQMPEEKVRYAYALTCESFADWGATEGMEAAPEKVQEMFTAPEGFEEVIKSELAKGEAR